MTKELKVYFSMFRIRFNYNLQYRAVVLGAVLKGFLWAMMEVLGYLAIYRMGGDGLPMELSRTVSYVWAHESFIVLFSVVFGDGEIFSAIRSGEVVYDLARPVGLYGRWYCQSASNRLSFALVNCLPVLILGALMPKPYGLTLPGSAAQVFLFLVSALLAFGVTVAMAMLKKSGRKNIEKFKVAVIDTIFSPKKLSRQDVAELRFIPGTDNKAQYILEAGIITTESKVVIPIVECRAPYKAFLDTVNYRQEIVNLIDDEVNNFNRYAGVKFGSMEAGNNEAGNWE